MEMISVRKNILLDLVTEYMFATTDCYDCLFQDVCQAKKSDINYIGTCVETAMEFLASGRDYNLCLSERYLRCPHRMGCHCTDGNECAIRLLNISTGEQE